VLTAGCITWAAVPGAIRAAHRLGFVERPIGYKRHGAATPYLGGAAVLAGVVVAVCAFGGGTGEYLPIVVGALVLLAVGTLDDKVLLGPGLRVLIEIGVALGVVAAGLGWEVFDSSAANTALTVIWVVAIVNSFNLMDNLDGAASTVAAVAGLGLAVAGVLDGDPVFAAFALAIAAASGAFLRYNLAGPARIFLGDGGSMPVGFLLAALTMAGPLGAGEGWAPVFAGGLLVGLISFDTALVVVSRLRRGVPVLSGGRDHLTHRLLAVLRSERLVAVALAVSQAGIAAAALLVSESNSPSVAVGAGLAFVVVAACAIAVLEWPLSGTAMAPGGRTRESTDTGH
jgi:UDP-GlcNAc:undecaprenyl-phosphate/decaprenyl-phosphate GlcNAc-1-phosphate transferase